MEELTCVSSPSNREEVRPDQRLIAHKHCGVVDRSTVEQLPPSLDHGVVPGHGDLFVVAVHFFAGVVLEMCLAIIIALTFGSHTHVARMSIIIFDVALSFSRWLLTLALAGRTSP